MQPIRKQYQIFIDRSPDAVFEFHASLKNHARLSRPEDQEEVLSPLDTEFEVGVKVLFRAKHGGVWHKLESEIVEWNPPVGFTDRQVSGPFSSWLHRHRFTPFEKGTLMSDQIEYLPPAGALGALAEKLWLGKHLDDFFNHRQKEAKRILEQFTRIKGR